MENSTPTTMPVVMTEATVEIPYQEKISRLFVFRFLWMFLEIWVLYVWAIWLMITYLGQFFYQLILGKRHKGMWNTHVRYFRHITKWQAYINWLTDKRPKFIED